MTRGRAPPDTSIPLHQQIAYPHDQPVQFISPPASATSQPPFFSPPHTAPRDAIFSEPPPAIPSIQVQTSATQTTNTPVSTGSGKWSSIGQPKGPRGAWKHSEYPRSQKFYGPTSFSAIFTDNDAKVNKDLLDIGEDKRKHPGAWILGAPLLGFHRPNGPTEREKQTLNALWNLPSKETCEALLTLPQPLSCPSLNFNMMQHCVTTLWSAFESELAAPRSEKPALDWSENGEEPPALLAISDAMFANEEAPLLPDPDDGVAWLNNFTGPNIRFEMMGMLFCFFGLAYLATQDWDPILKHPDNHGRNRKQAAWRMKECANVCLTMCDYSETVNYLVTALILNIKRLETGCTGDETYQMRRLHGDMVTTAITSGLHRLPDNSKITPASEYKRRLFGNIYCNDKIHASLNGIPPLLTQRFCDVQLCSDLADDIIFAPSEQLADAISKLDANGWNKTGACHEISTFLRARILIHMIREEILELALGVNVNVSEARINNLHQKSQQMFDSLPPQLHYFDPTGVPKASSRNVLYDQAFLNLQHLQNKFLLDRVAKARGLSNGQGLLNTAMSMIDLSLMFWSKRDQLLAHSHGFDWIMTYYGIPSAGVICVELLKTSSGQNIVQVSRSEAIQKLTLFIAFLEWIRETDGNWTLAQRLRKVVRRVLDYVLDVAEKDNKPDMVMPDGGDQELYDPMVGWGGGGFDDGNDLDWLNTIDWTQGSWMDFS
ncbi:uncharacterized protein RCO7_01105 [Rhynchosporium graminicola]|uniref:Xylanolytic transcriptional activator regulatory domain-containing protein n=1 Tax=Rhynchosporium graminicola TaxID=2792576 RepID=A0A1E1JQX2_9HELO|nr:uncharacterized protein RCO7_01105 [Rhynchosporium commune]